MPSQYCHINHSPAFFVNRNLSKYKPVAWPQKKTSFHFYYKVKQAVRKGTPVWWISFQLFAPPAGHCVTALHVLCCQCHLLWFPKLLTADPGFWSVCPDLVRWVPSRFWRGGLTLNFTLNYVPAPCTPCTLSSTTEKWTIWVKYKRKKKKKQLSQSDLDSQAPTPPRLVCPPLPFEKRKVK